MLDEYVVVDVAPFAGAWIEIQLHYSVFLYTFVAPFAGAWIEITNRKTLFVR